MDKETASENPSPSGDKRWDDPENVAMVERGIKDSKSGKVNKYSLDELKEMMCV